METSTSQPKKYWESFLKILPFVQWIMTIIIAAAVFGLGFRDSQTSQAQAVRDLQKDQDALRKTIDDRKNDRDKQIEDLKHQIVTRDIFEERTRAIFDEQMRQRQMIERILETKSNDSR